MKKCIVCMLMAIFLFITGGCTQKSSKELRIGILPDVDSIPLIIAKEMGYFEEEKVSVELHHFKSPIDRDSALQSHHIDGAISDVLAVCFAKENGFDVIITSMTNGSYKFLVAKDLVVSSIEELKEKDIGMSLNTIIEYTTDRILEEEGLSAKEINKVSIPNIPARLEMLQYGKIDAATLPEPLAAVAIANGAKLISSSDMLGINPGVLIFREETISTKEEEIKAIYRAYNKAIDYLQDEPIEEYVDVLITSGGFPKSIKNNMVLPKYHLAAMPEEQDVYEVISWLTEKGLIKKTYTYHTLVSDQFIE